jgi:hypothetical protein
MSDTTVHDDTRPCHSFTSIFPYLLTHHPLISFLHSMGDKFTAITAAATIVVISFTALHSPSSAAYLTGNVGVSYISLPSPSGRLEVVGKETA